jgi:hypothetical protein
MVPSRIVFGFVIAASVVSACASDTGTAPTPTVARLTPASAPVGATLTVTGAGFASTGNAVRIGGGYLLNLGSTGGTSITFALPPGLELCAPATQVCSAGYMEVRPGTYDVAVVTSKGVSSNTVTLTVTE